MTSISTHGLVTAVDGEMGLVGARCNACGTHTFPAQHGCPRCGAEMAPTALPRRGRLWSWTVQRTRPKPPYQGPDEFEPFALGYVDLGPLRVEARLAGKSPEAWTIGEPMQLVIGDADAEGNHWTYWFEGAGA